MTLKRELTRTEKACKLARPMHTKFIHATCGQMHTWSFEEALSHARRLQPRTHQRCQRCAKLFPIEQFHFHVPSTDKRNEIIVISMARWETAT
jgi:hypothetical protein